MNVEMLTNTQARLVLQGRLDVETAPKLRLILLESRNQGVKDFVLEMSQIEFMDSAGLAAMVSGLKQSKAEGGSLKVEAPSEAVRRVLELTLLDRVIGIVEG